MRSPAWDTAVQVESHIGTAANAQAFGLAMTAVPRCFVSGQL